MHLLSSIQYSIYSVLSRGSSLLFSLLSSLFSLSLSVPPSPSLSFPPLFLPIPPSLSLCPSLFLSLSLLPLPFPLSLPLFPSFPPSHPDEPCVNCSKEAVSFLHGFDSIWTILHHPLDLHGTEVCADWQPTARLKQYQRN